MVDGYPLYSTTMTHSTPPEAPVEKRKRNRQIPINLTQTTHADLCEAQRLIVAKAGVHVSKTATLARAISDLLERLRQESSNAA